MPCTSGNSDQHEDDRMAMLNRLREEQHQSRHGNNKPGVVSILHPKYTTPVPVHCVAVAEVNTRKSMFVVVNELNAKIPLCRSLCHVSRTAGLRVLVVTRNMINNEIANRNSLFWNHLTRGGHHGFRSRLDYLLSLNAGTAHSGEQFQTAVTVYLDYVGVSLEVLQVLRKCRRPADGRAVVDVGYVPMFRPAMQWQHDLAVRQHWSECDFERDAHLENQLKNAVFDADEVAFHRFIMRVLKYVREMSGNAECALAVNPNTRNVVGLAFTKVSANVPPITHCPIAMVNTLTREWHDYVPPANNPAAENPPQVVRAGDGGGVPAWWRKDLLDYFADIRFSTQAADVYEERHGKYWPAVGYDLYFSREPCVNCALNMMMRNKRILSVFYAEPHQRGGFGSNRHNNATQHPLDVLKNVYRVI